MHHPIDRITHTTAFGTPVVEHWLEREISRNGFLDSWCSWCKIKKDNSTDNSDVLKIYIFI